MSHHTSIPSRRSWPERLLWVLLIAASVILVSMGLLRSTFFGFMPEPAMIAAARVGACTFLPALQRQSLQQDGRSTAGTALVVAFVAAPAVLVGGAALAVPHSLLRHVAAAAVAVPPALTAILWGSRFWTWRSKN
ncbi:hypothetical protein [Arthrobacter sp. ISL-72]|uniref:hypothetical protein n=1 Tax=Arthrobacter sp. ISL-72 TaxID=2819114 RepID=UPI001BE7164C|nr:hypothetical protein [Arthrobacter sp. ISL-72]MBT2597923.1 hypothetical protein [Arthrobacter sp. ISL-72]